MHQILTALCRCSPAVPTAVFAEQLPSPRRLTMQLTAARFHSLPDRDGMYSTCRHFAINAPVCLTRFPAPIQSLDLKRAHKGPSVGDSSWCGTRLTGQIG